MAIDTQIIGILRLASFLAIIPFYKKATKKFYSHKVYSSLIVIILLCLFAYSNIGRQKIGLFEKSEIIILRYFPALANNISNLCLIWLATRSNKQGIQLFFDTFDVIDAMITQQFKTKIIEGKYLIQQFILGHLYLIAIVAFDIYATYSNLELWCYKYFINDVLQHYLMFVTIFLEFYFLKCINYRIAALNFIVEHLGYMSNFFKGNFFECTENVLKLHERICDLVDLFNNVFGWHIFLAMLQIVFKFLAVINNLIREDMGNWKDMFATIVWGIFAVMQGVVIATKCEQANKEGRKTIAVSYKTLHNYEDSNLIREKLFLLCHQASARCPTFNAAGFFNVDFAMLFTFINLITTYIIVIIEFSISKQC